jgi:uncharacterized damage-inducible protein DinB
MIEHVDQFIKYFESIRRRTLTYVHSIPADKIDWRPKTGELTCGDIVRHLAAAELMFVGAAVEGKWRYAGHERDNERGSLIDALNTLETSHGAAIKILATLSDADLAQPRPSLADGPPIRAWRLLMAMVEHEIHHRSQLAVYLSLLGVEPPQIYGLGVEDVIALATD